MSRRGRRCSDSVGAAAPLPAGLPTARSRTASTAPLLFDLAPGSRDWGRAQQAARASPAMLASQGGRASGGGLVPPPAPPSPDDLEAGSSKYTKRRRQRSGGLSSLRPRLLARAAAATAAVLLTALAGRIAAGLTHTPALHGASSSSSCLSDEQVRSTLQSLAAARRPWAAGAAEEPPGQAAHDVLAAGNKVAVPGVQPPRMSDEPYGRQSSANIPGEEEAVRAREAGRHAAAAGTTSDSAPAALPPPTFPLLMC